MGHSSFKTSVEAFFGFVWDFVRVVFWSLVLNPIVWSIWALIAPKSAVGLLNDKVRSNRRLFEYLGKFFLLFNYGAIQLLPWRSKRCFYQKFNPDNMSHKQKARAYREGWLKKDELSAEARAILWNSSSFYWEDLAKAALSLEQFIQLVDMSEYDILKIHIDKNTPSNEKMEVLLEKFGNNQMLQGVVFRAISKHGLSSELIKSVFSQAVYLGVRNVVMSALDEYREIQIVKTLKFTNSTEDNGIAWSVFLSNLNGNLHSSAQSSMTKQQFESYIYADKVFDNGILWEWMNDTTKREWVVNYVQNRLATGKASEAVIALVKANEWWREKLLFS